MNNEIVSNPNNEVNCEAVHTCPVIEVKKEKHENADTLSVIKVYDYTYVGKTSQWTDGEYAVWIPPDSIVDINRPEFATSEISKNGRVKAKKIRGVVSYGLLIPAPTGRVVREDLSKELGVTNYQPELAQVITGKKNNLFYSNEEASAPSGLVIPKYDLKNFLKCGKTQFSEGELCLVQEKYHGESSRYVYWQDQFHCSSHYTFKKEFGIPPKITLEELTEKMGDAEKALSLYTQKVINFKSNRNKWWDILLRNMFLQQLLKSHPGLVCYGEIYGGQGKMKYGLTQLEFAGFDILNTYENRFLDSEEMLGLYKWHGVKTCHVLHENYPFEFDKLVAMGEGESLVTGAKHLREGVVVRPVKERIDYRGNRVIYKIKNPEFLEKF